MIAEAGVATCDVDAERSSQPLTSPDDWWVIALGSGYRGTTDKLDPGAQEAVKRDTLAPLRARNALTAETNALYAIATKSPGGDAERWGGRLALSASGRRSARGATPPGPLGDPRGARRP
ncbi:hypothetical protein [Sorangium sp. So ce1151]|uniref:hypothetical protein n=1 Tax=Sorangium sp. So ce1151 TaxID=3133332 RepID=UPI003F6285EE